MKPLETAEKLRTCATTIAYGKECKIYIQCLKKGTPTLSIVTLRRIEGFSRFFAQTILT